MPTANSPSSGQFSGFHAITERLSLYAITAQEIRRIEAPISKSDSDQTSTVPKARTEYAKRISSPTRIPFIARVFPGPRRALKKHPRSTPSRAACCRTSGCQRAASEPAESASSVRWSHPFLQRSRDGGQENCHGARSPHHHDWDRRSRNACRFRWLFLRSACKHENDRRVRAQLEHIAQVR